jgi:hypothetical protein
MKPIDAPQREKKPAEEPNLAEDKIAEEARLNAEEEARSEEATVLAEELRQAKLETDRIAEEKRFAVEKSTEEARLKAEEVAHIEEEKRLAERASLKSEEEARIAEEKLRADEKILKPHKRSSICILEVFDSPKVTKKKVVVMKQMDAPQIEKKPAEEPNLAEEKIAEEARLNAEEEAHSEEATMLAEEVRQAKLETERIAEEKLFAEEKISEAARLKTEEEVLIEEEKRLAERASLKSEEEARIAEEKLRADETIVKPHKMSSINILEVFDSPKVTKKKVVVMKPRDDIATTEPQVPLNKSICSQCGDGRERSEFSNSQFKKSATTRRCKQCIAEHFAELAKTDEENQLLSKTEKEQAFENGEEQTKAKAIVNGEDETQDKILAEEVRLKAEQARIVEEKRLAEDKIAEEARFSEEKIAGEARLKAKEVALIEEEKRLAEGANLKAEEEARIVEEKLRADEKIVKPLKRSSICILEVFDSPKVTEHKVVDVKPRDAPQRGIKQEGLQKNIAEEAHLKAKEEASIVEEKRPAEDARLEAEEGARIAEEKRLIEGLLLKAEEEARFDARLNELEKKIRAEFETNIEKEVEVRVEAALEARLKVTEVENIVTDDDEEVIIEEILSSVSLEEEIVFHKEPKYGIESEPVKDNILKDDRIEIAAALKVSSFLRGSISRQRTSIWVASLIEEMQAEAIQLDEAIEATAGTSEGFEPVAPVPKKLNLKDRVAMLEGDRIAMLEGRSRESYSSPSIPKQLDKDRIAMLEGRSRESYSSPSIPKQLDKDRIAMLEGRSRESYSSPSIPKQLDKDRIAMLEGRSRESYSSPSIPKQLDKGRIAMLEGPRRESYSSPSIPKQLDLKNRIAMLESSKRESYASHSINDELAAMSVRIQKRQGALKADESQSSLSEKASTQVESAYASDSNSSVMTRGDIQAGIDRVKQEMGVLQERISGVSFRTLSDDLPLKEDANPMGNGPAIEDAKMVDEAGVYVEEYADEEFIDEEIIEEEIIEEEIIEDEAEDDCEEIEEPVGDRKPSQTIEEFATEPAQAVEKPERWIKTTQASTNPNEASAGSITCETSKSDKKKKNVLGGLGKRLSLFGRNKSGS